jgi:hypothetical protein
VPKVNSAISILPVERAASVILVVRSQKVILDSDLAALYGVDTKNLNKAVSRNLARFPDDFMFQLTTGEWDQLREQMGSSKGRGGRRTPPNVFTEQGVAMLSGLLNSSRAIAVNIAIMRAFVKLRRILSENEGLARKFRAMEKKYDGQFRIVFDAIRELMEPPEDEEKKGRIGFRGE